MSSQLPNGLQKYAASPVFTETSTPEKLTTAHDTKVGVWGKLIVSEGALEFVVPGPPATSERIAAGAFALIEPTVPHHIRLIGSVEFQIEFYR